MPWPLPALVTWALAWLVWTVLDAAAVAPWIALAAGSVIGAVGAWWGSTPWRRVFMAAGFPLLLLASGVGAAIPAWSWLLPLAGLALLYPVGSWRDAPLFPTPRGALRGLSTLAPVADGASIVDAGCGVGDGLRELRREYPQAVLHGLEWSWPLRFACAWRCPFAMVRRADIWTADWSAHGMVYVFQRPETMARAATKAAAELRPGAWLASLEFEATSLEPAGVLRCPDGRPVWLYQQPFVTRGRVSASPAPTSMP